MARKINLKPEYYEKLSGIGKIVDNTAINFLEKKVYPNFPEKEMLYSKMLGRKKDTQKLRAMAAYLAFVSFSDLDVIKDNNVRKIIAAVELENYSNYELNWLFDEKAGTNSVKESKIAGLATHGFINDALKLVWDMPKIAGIFLEINDRTHRGWTPEIYDLRFNNKELLLDFNLFWNAYKKRNIEAGGQFYGNYVSLAHVFNKEKSSKTHDELKKIYTEFGESIQIINDLSDFICTGKPIANEKDVADQFSDLRKGLITWPIWLMYNYGGKDEREFLYSIPEKGISNMEETNKVKKLFYNSAYEKINESLRRKRSELQHNVKSLGIEEKVSGLINVMISMISSNKFFYHMKQEKEVYN